MQRVLSGMFNTFTLNLLEHLGDAIKYNGRHHAFTVEE